MLCGGQCTAPGFEVRELRRHCSNTCRAITGLRAGKCAKPSDDWPLVQSGDGTAFIETDVNGSCATKAQPASLTACRCSGIEGQRRKRRWSIRVRHRRRAEADAGRPAWPIHIDHHRSSCTENTLRQFRYRQRLRLLRRDSRYGGEKQSSDHFATCCSCRRVEAPTVCAWRRCCNSFSPSGLGSGPIDVRGVI